MALRHRAFDFCWSYCHAVSIFQDIVPRYRLAVDSNQVVRSLFSRHFLFEELIDSCAIGDTDIVSIAPAGIVYVEYSHFQFLSILLVRDFFGLHVTHVDANSLSSGRAARADSLLLHSISFQVEVFGDLLMIRFVERV